MEKQVERKLLLFAGSVNKDLSSQIAEELGVDLGNVKLEKFANGEIYVRYLESLRGADVFIMQSVCSDGDFDVNDALMELLIMVDAARRASANRISAVISHYGYARQDRKAAPREPISAKLVACLLEHAGVDNVITIDLHQDAIQGFFNRPVNHMTAMPIFVDYFKKKIEDFSNVCVVSPDVGRAKAAKKFSNMLDCDIAIMHKDRPKHNQAEITALIGDVENKICILNDDMIDTAGSLVAAAETLKEKGALKVYACATHGIFSDPAFERLENSCIEEVVVTNAVPVPQEHQTGKIHVLSIAPLVGKTIEAVFSCGSVSQFFEQMGVKKDVQLIVGLGNPGKEYETTRHNAGWLVIDVLAEKLRANYWKNEAGAQTAHVKFCGDELILAKPQSFMNASGGPVSKLAAQYKIAPEDIIVVHDEMDIELGCVRVKVGGGHGGHNGLRSIHAKLGSNAYARVRVGVGHPHGKRECADFVLSTPRGKDAQTFETSITVAADAALCILENGADSAMNKFNQRKNQQLL